MASVVGICNRALQKLGAKSIVAIDENSPSAKNCNMAYEAVRDAMLRTHTWSFAKKRASLAAESPAPAFGRAASYVLPSDFIRLYKPYPEDNSLDIDYEIENGRILSNLDAPLEIRYIARITDANLMDALFREALATNLAVEMCEALTQSNTKKAGLKEDLILIMREARKANAIEQVAQRPPEDEWITIRR